MKTPEKTTNRRKPVGSVSASDVADIVKSASARKATGGERLINAARGVVTKFDAQRKADRASPGKRPSKAKAPKRAKAAKKAARPKPAKRPLRARKPPPVGPDGKKLTKQAQLEAMLIAAPVPLKAVMAQFGWKAHSARAAIAILNNARQEDGESAVVTTESEVLGRCYSLTARKKAA